MAKWKEWKVAAAVVASLGVVAIEPAIALANSPLVINQPTIDAPLSYTVKTSAEGTPVWVTIVPQGHTINPRVIKTEPWWKWGNTLTDVYLIAVGHPSDVEMILSFQEQPDGLPEAHLYGDVDGHKQIQYEWVKNKTQGNPTPTYTLKLLTLDGVQSIDMIPTTGKGWVVTGHPNYNVQLQSDMNLTDTPPRTELVGSSGTTVPQWETSQVADDPHPDWSYNRFQAFSRMKDAPPFRVENPFMPSFPYIGIHYGTPDWFTATPNPFYFNTKTFQFTEEQFVGYQEGGIYQLNSVASPPKVDFESPFAFYNFDPKTRFAQLVVRAQNYSANDPYFYDSTPKNLQTYRYSWSMGTNGMWDYGLTMGGFRSFPGKIHIGNSNVEGVAASKLPQWTIHHPWDTVTLDQAMNGYFGSEGIYFYSVQSPDMSSWMLGYVNQPPQYLAEPKLPNQVELNTTSTISVPLGFRDEYSAAYFHNPVLYASPIDHLMHLLRASGGVYHFSKTKILRTTNLDGGKYINDWAIETMPTKKKPSNVVEQVANVDGYILYSGLHGVVIRKSNVSPTRFTIDPPTNKASWRTYVAKVKPYQHGNNPTELYRWILPFRGPTFAFPHASIQHLQVNRTSVSFELSVSSGRPTVRQIKGLPTQPGHYMVTYHTATQDWSYMRAESPKLTGSITGAGAVKVGQLSKYVVIVKNQGNVPWTGTVTALAGQLLVSEQQITIDGGQTYRQTLGWTPEDTGKYALRLLVGKRSLAIRNEPVSVAKGLRYDILFHPGTWADASNGLLVTLLGALAVGAMGVLLRTLRKEEPM